MHQSDTHSRSLAPLIQPRPHTSPRQSGLVLRIQPHVFYAEHHQHHPQSSLRGPRCNLLRLSLPQLSPIVPRPGVFEAKLNRLSSGFFTTDCDHSSASGFIFYRDSFDCCTDSYLSPSSFRWGVVGVQDGWVNDKPCGPCECMILCVSKRAKMVCCWDGLGDWFSLHVPRLLLYSSLRCNLT